MAFCYYDVIQYVYREGGHIDPPRRRISPPSVDEEDIFLSDFLWCVGTKNKFQPGGKIQFRTQVVEAVLVTY